MHHGHDDNDNDNDDDDDDNDDNDDDEDDTWASSYWHRLVGEVALSSLGTRVAS